MANLRRSGRRSQFLEKAAKHYQGPAEQQQQAQDDRRKQRIRGGVENVLQQLPDCPGGHQKPRVISKNDEIAIRSRKCRMRPAGTAGGAGGREAGCKILSSLRPTMAESPASGAFG